MRAVGLISGLELRRRLRDRSVLVQVLVAPLVLAFILDAAIGGFTSEALTLGVIDRDGSPVSARVLEGLVDAGLDARPIEGDARSLIDDGTLDAAIEIPEGFAQAVTSGSGYELRVIADPDRAVTTAIAEGVAGGIVDQVAAAGGAVEIDVQLPGGTADFDPIAYSAPAMAMLFLFFMTGATARSLMSEQRDGTLPRVMAAPVTPGQVVAGKTVAVFTVAVLTLAVLWLVTSVGLGASWGDPVAVATVLVLTAAAIAGIGMVITALSRTEAQADTLTSLVTFTLVMVGGNFFSPADSPPALETLRLATPNGWALQSLADIQVGAGVEAITTTVVVLSVTAAVTGLVGTVVLQRRIRP